jgi:hypothetical protein
VTDADVTPVGNALRHPARGLYESETFRSSRRHVGLSAARTGPRTAYLFESRLGLGWANLGSRCLAG